MKADKKSIYVDGYELRKLLKRAQFCMTKADRIIYGTPVLEANIRAINDFVIAYEFDDEEERAKNIRRFCASFNALKIECRIIAEDNVLKVRDPEHPENNPETLKKLISERIALIDDALEKWRSSVGKGKTTIPPLRPKVVTKS